MFHLKSAQIGDGRFTGDFNIVLGIIFNAACVTIGLAMEADLYPN